jgi:transcription antitermination factor NusG
MPLDGESISMRISALTGTEHTRSCFAPSASVTDMPWHVLYTQPNAERAAEHKLRREGAGVWLPLDSRTWANRQRKISVTFPRYLFLQLTGERVKWGCTVRSDGGEELGSVLRSPAGNPLAVPLAALEALWGQCGPNGVIYPPEVREARRGDALRVLTGPFAGFTGICTLTTRQRVTLLLSMFGRDSAVEYARSAVEIA